MKDLISSVRSQATARGLWAGAEAIVVGVSGGVDSVVLLHVLHRLLSGERRLSVVHVNYGLRPGADDDEALVRDLCDALDPVVDCHVYRPDMDQAASSPDSLQEIARDIRYRQFQVVAEAEGAGVVAVAHHREDQAETLLLRLFRGTGPSGLAGMRWSRSLAADTDIRLVRPLLGLSQAVIHEYATTHRLPWREDPSNTSGPFARAKLRTTVLPAIEEAFPGATGRIAHAGELLREVAEATLEPERASWYDRVVEVDEGTLHLDGMVLRSAPRVWAERVLLDALGQAIPDAPCTSAAARSVFELLDAQVGTRVELGAGVVWRERGGLRLVSHRAVSLQPVTLEPGTVVETPYGTISRDPDRPREDVDVSFGEPDQRNTATAFLDADHLAEPVTVRTWRDGDRLQPLGMKGTKTVADVLTNARVPPHRRARMLVVAVPDHVVWIPGIHLDHRQRIRSETDVVARLTFTQPDLMVGARPPTGRLPGNDGKKGLPT